VSKSIPVYGFVYDVRSGKLIEVEGATEVGKAAESQGDELGSLPFASRNYGLMRTLWLNAFAVTAVVIAVTLVVVKNIQGDTSNELVSRPGDFLNTNSLLRIGIGPSEWFC
jgi:hypothetical protein